jgi:hypothetical protein
MDWEHLSIVWWMDAFPGVPDRDEFGWFPYPTIKTFNDRFNVILRSREATKDLVFL